MEISFVEVIKFNWMTFLDQNEICLGAEWIRRARLGEMLILKRQAWRVERWN